VSGFERTLVVPRGTKAEVIRDLCKQAGSSTQVLIHPSDLPAVEALAEDERAGRSG